MRVLITGAAGFIGRHVASALFRRDRLRDAGAAMRAPAQVILADLAPSDGITEERFVQATGDFRDPEFLSRITAGGVDSVFHLAATLTIEAETDFDRGMDVNLHGLVRLLDACRRQEQPPRFVFASSIAAFGGPLPETVDDSVAQTPQTSYGTHKSVAELLINDYSRHGFIDGRALRLPIVLTRPGGSSPTVSDRIAAIVREPLHGRDVGCPLHPQTRIPVASVQHVAQALLDLHDLPAAAFGHTRAMNLPSLTVRVDEMVASLQRYAGRHAIGRVHWQADAGVQAVVDGWPVHFVSERATRAGIGAEAGFDEIVDAYVDEHLPELAGTRP